MQEKSEKKIEASGYCIQCYIRNNSAPTESSYVLQFLQMTIGCERFLTLTYSYIIIYIII